jgi:hypothetical protein
MKEYQGILFIAPRHFLDLLQSEGVQGRPSI